MTDTAPEPTITPEEAAKIDALVWEAASAEACKVAVLIARATDAAKAAGLDAKPQVIAARIYALTETGKLSVQGNVRRWRAAEVKRGV